MSTPQAVSASALVDTGQDLLWKLSSFMGQGQLGDHRTTPKLVHAVQSTLLVE